MFDFVILSLIFACQTTAYMWWWVSFQWTYSLSVFGLWFVFGVGFVVLWMDYFAVKWISDILNGRVHLFSAGLLFVFVGFILRSIINRRCEAMMIKMWMKFVSHQCDLFILVFFSKCGNWLCWPRLLILHTFSPFFGGVVWSIFHTLKSFPS